MMTEHLFVLAEKYKIPEILIGYYWGWYMANSSKNKSQRSIIHFEHGILYLKLVFKN